MQYKIAQQMIQEVVDGKDAEELVNEFVDGDRKEDPVDEEPTNASRLIDNFMKNRSE